MPLVRDARNLAFLLAPLVLAGLATASTHADQPGPAKKWNGCQRRRQEAPGESGESEYPHRSIVLAGTRLVSPRVTT
jgi:hypothetical protein